MLSRRSFLTRVSSCCAALVALPQTCAAWAGLRHDALVAAVPQSLRTFWVWSDTRQIVQDGSRHTPFASLAAALQQAEAGSTIYLLPHHHEPQLPHGVLLRSPGTRDQPVVIVCA